jgi:putative methyltransferase (TIGR04325 family)
MFERERIRNLVKSWSPPNALLLGRRLLDYVRPAPWEYVPNGWETTDPSIKGWNVERVIEIETRKWQTFLKLLEGSNALGLNHESPEPTNSDLDAHNLVMSYAYVLALTARMQPRISVLDWGGGLGHYYAIAKSLIRDLELDYYCYDLPLICAAGRQLLPEVTFYDQEDLCLSRQYDLVFSSYSLPYSRDWKKTAAGLAAMTSSYLYITRLPVVEKSKGFVVVQRPRAVGYGTEYLSWFLNRQEFLDYLSSLGMELVREFLVADKPLVHRAPEQAVLRGFLFHSKAQKDGRHHEG